MVDESFINSVYRKAKQNRMALWLVSNPRFRRTMGIRITVQTSRFWHLFAAQTILSNRKKITLAFLGSFVEDVDDEKHMTHASEIVFPQNTAEFVVSYWKDHGHSVLLNTKHKQYIHDTWLYHSWPLHVGFKVLKNSSFFFLSFEIISRWLA